MTGTGNTFYPQFIDPIDEQMYVSEYEEEMYYSQHSISETMYQLCTDIEPPGDPQLWSQSVRDNIDFCSLILA